MILSRPVPVLIMARELDQGGVERDVAKIAIGLDRSRFVPHVAAFYPHGMRYEDLRAAGVPILPVPLKSLLSLDAVTAAVRMRRYIHEHRIQIVHCYDASGVFGLPVGWFSRVPVLIGSQLSYRNLLDARSQKLLRFSERFADAILVNCEAMRRHMAEDEHVPPDRIEVCYNGVETATFFPRRGSRPEQLSDASVVIGTVCALRHEKNLPLLQEAFAQVLPQQRGMRLVVVGSGQELQGLRQNAARLQIADASVFIPATPEVAKWLNAIDIFVLPSYSEAFSNSLLEAMACGCAVVGSNVGGTPELTGTDGQRGLLFESGNAGALAAQLRTLVENRERRQALGENASRFAKESLSIESAARCTAEIYDKWLERKSGPKPNRG